MAVSKLSIVKFIEMALTFACLGLHYNTMYEAQEHTRLLTAGTYVGYSIILVALAAGYLMNTPINKRLDIFFSLIGCTLFVACGALVIEHWKDTYNNKTRDLALTKGSLSVLNGLVFLIDVVFTFKD